MTAPITIAAAEARKLFIAKPKRRGKYNASPQVIDGIRFASIAESKRYVLLKQLQRVGRIKGLKCHPSFTLRVRKRDKTLVDIGTVVYDFSYICDGKLVIEDVKGGKATDTPICVWKRWHFEAQYGMEVRLV